MEVVESKTPIVILSYSNCEIYCCHLDGYKTHTRAMMHRLAEIEEIFLHKPNDAKFRVWYNVDENSLDRKTMQLIAESILQFQSHIYKIAFIGLHGFTKWKFDNILANTFDGIGICR